jgi:hypothetical protein
MRKSLIVIVVMVALSSCAMRQNLFSSSGEAAVPKVRISTLEESPSELTANVADMIIASKMETMTVDYDCFSFPDCKAQVVRIKKALPNIRIRLYVNPMETFVNDRELNERPVMKPMVEDVRTNRPGYYLYDIKGKNVQWWTEYPMYMMNLSDECPVYEGKVWSEFLVDSLYEKIYLPNKNLVDGIELDNLWPYVSWINDARSVQIDLNGDGHGEDYWTMDYHWRKGIRHMLDYIRQKFPANFVITGRGFQYNYVDKVDGLTFETLFAPYMSEAMQGGNFARVNRWISLSKPGQYYTLNEVAGTPEENMTYLAIALLGDGYFALDGGPSRHGVFGLTANYYELGRPLGPAVYPYPELFNSKVSLTGLTGQYSLADNGWIRLNPGQSISLKVGKGINTQFIYQIIGGKYCESTLDLQYPGQLPKEAKGVFDAHRWQDGEYFALANDSGEIKWTYAGPGYALLTNVIQYDTNNGKKYFQRLYEKGVVIYNPGEQDLTIPISGGGSIMLKAGQGKVLYYH